MIIREDLPLERRQQQRMTLSRPASLNYPPLGLLQVHIDNISHTGAFITSGTIRLGLYNMAEIIHYIGNRLLPIRVEVVRVSARGAGLRFVNPDPQLLQTLENQQGKLDPANDPFLQ